MLTSRMGIGGAESHILTLARSLRHLGQDIVVASAGGALADTLVREGIEHVTLPLDSTSPLSLALAYEGLCALIERHSPDIIHSHSRIPSVLVERYKTQKRSRVPFVTTAHMPFSTALPYKMLSEWGERCIAVSEDIREYLIDNYSIPSERIEIINNGVDSPPDKEQIKIKCALVRGSLGIPREAHVYMSASRSSQSRAALCEYLCSGAVHLLGENEYLLLCISGKAGKEKDLTKELKAQARRANRALGRRAVILIEGAWDVSAYLCAADVFIGVSRAAMEAMAYSLPVIIAGNEGVGGIFSRQNALILEKANLTGRGSLGSFDKVADMMDRLKDPEYREAMGRFSHEYASTRFSSEAMAERTLEVYERATRKKLLLVGYYGAKNTGDDAALAILRERLADEYDIYYTAKRADTLDEYSILQTDTKRLSRAIRDSYAVIFGPGNLIQDETSLRSLGYYYAIFKEARRQDRPCAFFSAGIGPIKREISQKMAREMLSHSDYVSVREPNSLCYAKALTSGREIHIGADTVLLCDRKKYPHRIKVGARGYYVLCPRGELCHSDVRQLYKFISEAEREGLSAVLVAMDGAHDLKLCRTLSKGKYTVLERVDAPTLLDVIQGARFTISARLHGSVLSALADVTFVSIDCDGRLGSFGSYIMKGSRVHAGKLECAELWASIQYASDSRTRQTHTDKTQLLRDRAEADIRRLREFLDCQK